MKSDRRLKRQRTNDVDVDKDDVDEFFFRLATASQVQQDEKDANEMLAFGYESKIYRDKERATKIENGDYLILWKSIDIEQHHKSERPLCWMDRYDARHLMEDWIKLPQQRGKNGEVEGAEGAVLDPAFDKDRYKDLDYHDLYDPEIAEDADENSGNRGAAIPYEYCDDKVEQLNEVQKETAKRYNTPNDLSLPESQQQLTVIESVVQEIKRTAKHSADINMMEIKFQVRNSSNTLYAFLSKHDSLYPFYKHLLLLKDDDSITKKTTSTHTALVDYGSSSSDDEEEEEDKDRKLITTPTDKSLKEVIDKTAKFVAKSKQGQQLLQHIRSNNRNNPKFDFLNEASAYHAYFQQQIRGSCNPQQQN